MSFPTIGAWFNPVFRSGGSSDGGYRIGQDQANNPFIALPQPRKLIRVSNPRLAALAKALPSDRGSANNDLLCGPSKITPLASAHRFQPAVAVQLLGRLEDTPRYFQKRARQYTYQNNPVRQIYLPIWAQECRIE